MKNNKNKESSHFAKRNFDTLQEFELFQLVKKRYRKREAALKNLLTLGEGDESFNLDFIDNFDELFGIDEENVCKELSQNKSEIFTARGILAKGKVGEATFIRAGSEVELIVKKIKNVKSSNNILIKAFPKKDDILSSRWDNVRLMNPGIDANHWHIRRDFQTSSKIITISGDDFFNQTCIHLILNDILDSQGVENYIHQYDVFYCKRGTKLDGYNITEFAKDGDLFDYLNRHEITDNLLMDILKQVFTPLNILKHPRNAFIHGDLKCKNVFASQNGKTVFKIADYDKSSIFWNGVRFYNRRIDYFENFSESLVLKFAVSIETSEDGIEFYTTSLPKSASKLPMMKFLQMHNAFGSFLTLDYYTFIFSLVMHPKVYKFCSKNHNTKFFGLWKYIWIDREDTAKVSSFVDEEHRQLSKLQGDKFDARLKEMQSITSILEFFQKSGLKFRYSLDFNDFFSLKSPDFPDLSVERNLKLDECKSGICNAGKHSKFYGKIYNWESF